MPALSASHRAGLDSRPSAVAADDHLVFTALGGQTADRLADDARHLCRQVTVHHAADIIFPEDGGLHIRFNAARNGRSRRFHARWG